MRASMQTRMRAPAVHAGGSGGDGRQVAHGHDGLATARGQALRDARRDSKAGESAGSAAERDRVEIAGREAGFPQQLVRHRQQPAGVAAADDLVALAQFRTGQQCCRTRLRRRVDGQDRHASATRTGASPARASWRRRNPVASSSSATTGAGGSEAMKSRP